MSFSEQLIAWRRELHQNPELSGQEVETTARLREWLTAAGIAPLDYDLQTGLVAEIGTGNALVALRADIDALPIDERSGVPFSSRRRGDACLRTRHPHQRDPRRRVKAEGAGSLAQRSRAAPVPACGREFRRSKKHGAGRGVTRRTRDFRNA